MDCASELNDLAKKTTQGELVTPCPSSQAGVESVFLIKLNAVDKIDVPVQVEYCTYFRRKPLQCF